MTQPLHQTKIYVKLFWDQIHHC